VSISVHSVVEPFRKPHFQSYSNIIKDKTHSDSTPNPEALNFINSQLGMKTPVSESEQ
jgi:hypothetical protein